MPLSDDAANAREKIVPSALHKIPATPKTVHWGYFAADLAPVVKVKSGDIIQAEAITHHAGDDPRCTCTR